MVSISWLQLQSKLHDLDLHNENSLKSGSVFNRSRCNANGFKNSVNAVIPP